MPYYTNDGVKIHYEIEGEGPIVVMIHGFASSLEGNWKQTNWVDFLKDKYQLLVENLRQFKGHNSIYTISQNLSIPISLIAEFIVFLKSRSIVDVYRKK